MGRGDAGGPPPLEREQGRAFWAVGLISLCTVGLGTGRVATITVGEDADLGGHRSLEHRPSMEAGLLSAILAITLVQVEMTTQDLDLQKIAGFWREVGVASSQNLALKTPKRLEALFLTLSGEELTVKVAYNRSAKPEKGPVCPCLSLLLPPPGHREIHVIDTDYEQYAILRVSLHWQGKEFHVLKYFTRSLEGEYEPGFWRFRELTADTGLYLVARYGRCAKLLKEQGTVGPVSGSPGPSLC
ncbi:Epididymal-specific lipocalin-8 [Camelus dromedarius]|uniref:Epididymal-specific lipocalin-8 n=1 Tax=Camelus dromedarius TaxID=9838 RepID=A0A5N4EAF9_CAMDR|nr:Epididymal-specific lipocalin-8 [Camelus dromedarius]